MGLLTTRKHLGGITASTLESFAEALALAAKNERGHVDAGELREICLLVLQRLDAYPMADSIGNTHSPLHTMSRLEDAAFHFQTCRTCRKDGDDACPSGRRFAAFLRGEPDADLL